MIIKPGKMLSSKILSSSILGVNSISSRAICHKSKLRPKRNNYHWPYEQRSWNHLNCLLDFDTKGKFDENTKIIQVEGNISAGKEEFAKGLAEELGMAYFPQPKLENYYINRHGFDYRALNPLLPERLRLCDWEMFHENPTRHSVLHMQYYLFRLRVFEYHKALAHLFNTGQGVVMTRTAFTERGIVNAMHDLGWLPKGYLRGDGVRFFDWVKRYLYLRNMCLARTFKPHLTIYLDTPVDTCMERIKNDPDPMISNSKALTREFLVEVENNMKTHVLPRQNHNMHVMVVDHPDHKSIDEVRDIIDDLESLNFEYDPHDTRFEDWNTDTHRFWYLECRRDLTTEVYAIRLNRIMQAPWYDIAGLGDSITEGDLILRDSLFKNHVGPVGAEISYETDTRIHGWKAIFGGGNLSQRLHKRIYTDFV